MANLFSVSRLFLATLLFSLFLWSCTVVAGDQSGAAGQKGLGFQNVAEVNQVLGELEALGLSQRHAIPKLAAFHSMLDEYTELGSVDPKKFDAELQSRKTFLDLQAIEGSSDRQVALKLPQLFAGLVDPQGHITIGKTVYNLLDPSDLTKFENCLAGKSTASRGVLGFLLPAMGHTIENGTILVATNAPFDPSLQWATYSNATQHTENPPLFTANSYWTTTLPITAHGRPVLIQMWKGHMSGFGLTGAETSTYNPPAMEQQLRVRVASIPTIFGPIYYNELYWVSVPSSTWYPMYDNQLLFNWNLRSRINGQVILSYGNPDGYENSPKWWAGKWYIENPSISHYAQNYVLGFTIRDRNGNWIYSGSW